MSYDFKNFSQRLSEVKDWLSKELSSIRTGRATISLLDGVRVNSYGSLSPLNQVASVNIEDVRTIKISPYDISQLKEIEKSITDADLGVSVSSDSKGVRIFFPELTSERRELLAKQAGKKVEEARISVRKERDEIWSQIQKDEKDGKINEDDKFRAKDEMQKKVDAVQDEFEKMLEAKEKEIKS